MRVPRLYLPKPLTVGATVALDDNAFSHVVKVLRLKPGAEGFARAWELAIDAGIARLEDCALERALLGEERPVVSAGKLVTTYTRYDTQLLLFLLRQRRGHRYAPVGKAPLPHEEENPDEIIAEIDAQLDRMRDTWLKEQEAGGDTA